MGIFLSLLCPGCPVLDLLSTCNCRPGKTRFNCKIAVDIANGQIETFIYLRLLKASFHSPEDPLLLLLLLLYLF